MRALVATAVTTCLAALPGPPALAQDPCAEDVQRLCPEVKSGGGRVARCLRAIDPLERPVAILPDYPRAWATLAEAYDALGRKEEASRARSRAAASADEE